MNSFYINFVVEGQSFSTFKASVLAHPQSSLCQFVGGVSPKFIGHCFGGIYYINRDATSFYYVTKYLQGYKLDEFEELIVNEVLLKRIRNDGEFYGFPELVNHANELISKLNPQVSESEVKERVTSVRTKLLSLMTMLETGEKQICGTEKCKGLTSKMTAYLSRANVQKKWEDHVRKYGRESSPGYEFVMELLRVLAPGENEIVLEDLMKEQAKVVAGEGAKLMEKIQEMTQNVKLDDVLELLKKTNGLGDVIEMLKTNGVIKL